MSGAFAAVKARDVSWQAVRMGDVDAAELARLRAKAYGAGAEGLTDAEASRLRTLEDRARDRPAPGEVAAGLDDRMAAVDAPGREPHPVADRPVVRAVAVVALVILSGVVGFLLARTTVEQPTSVAASSPFLQPGDTVATYEDRRAVVQRALNWGGERVQLLGAAQGVSVWWGVTGAETCVALDVAQVDTAVMCDETEVVREHGIRQRRDFAHVPAAEGMDPQAIDETNALFTTLVFTGNPYTGQFMVVIDD